MNTTLDGLEGYFTFVTPAQMQTDSRHRDHQLAVRDREHVQHARPLRRARPRVRRSAKRTPVTVLSDGYWRRRFGADPNIVGKTLTLNGTPFQVIGVMPPDFVFPYPGMLGPSGFTRVTSIDAWLPIAFSGPMAATNRMLNAQGQIVRNVHWLGAIGRLEGRRVRGSRPKRT